MPKYQLSTNCEFRFDNAELGMKNNPRGVVYCKNL